MFKLTNLERGKKEKKKERRDVGWFRTEGSGNRERGIKEQRTTKAWEEVECERG